MDISHNKLKSSIEKNSLKRKADLEPLAKELGIEPKRYKNKKTLISAMIDATEFENSADPVTLENISDIPIHLLVIWFQNNCKYAARVESIYNLFENNLTLNPWCIDKVSSFQLSSSKKDYDTIFDLKYVDGLKEIVYSKYKQLDIQPVLEDIPEHVKFRHSIEDICKNMYITHIIDFFEHVNDIHLFRCLLRNSISSTLMQILCQLDTSYTAQGAKFAIVLDRFRFEICTFKGSGLKILYLFFTFCKEHLSDTIIQTICDELDEQVKELTTVIHI